MADNRETKEERKQRKEKEKQDKEDARVEKEREAREPTRTTLAGDGSTSARVMGSRSRSSSAKRQRRELTDGKEIDPRREADDDENDDTSTSVQQGGSSFKPSTHVNNNNNDEEDDDDDVRVIDAPPVESNEEKKDKDEQMSPPNPNQENKDSDADRLAAEQEEREKEARVASEKAEKEERQKQLLATKLNKAAVIAKASANANNNANVAARSDSNGNNNNNINDTSALIFLNGYRRHSRSNLKTHKELDAEQRQAQGRPLRSERVLRHERDLGFDTEEKHSAVPSETHIKIYLKKTRDDCTPPNDRQIMEEINKINPSVYICTNIKKMGISPWFFKAATPKSASETLEKLGVDTSRWPEGQRLDEEGVTDNGFQVGNDYVINFLPYYTSINDKTHKMYITNVPPDWKSKDLYAALSENWPILPLSARIKYRNTVHTTTASAEFINASDVEHLVYDEHYECGGVRLRFQHHERPEVLEERWNKRNEETERRGDFGGTVKYGDNARRRRGGQLGAPRRNFGPRNPWEQQQQFAYNASPFANYNPNPNPYANQYSNSNPYPIPNANFNANYLEPFAQPTREAQLQQQLQTQQRATQQQQQGPPANAPNQQPQPPVTSPRGGGGAQRPDQRDQREQRGGGGGQGGHPSNQGQGADRRGQGPSGGGAQGAPGGFGRGGGAPVPSSIEEFQAQMSSMVAQVFAEAQVKAQEMVAAFTAKFMGVAPPPPSNQQQQFQWHQQVSALARYAPSRSIVAITTGNALNEEQFAAAEKVWQAPPPPQQNNAPNANYQRDFPTQLANANDDIHNLGGGSPPQQQFIQNPFVNQANGDDTSSANSDPRLDVNRRNGGSDPRPPRDTGRPDQQDKQPSQPAQQQSSQQALQQAQQQQQQAQRPAPTNNNRNVNENDNDNNNNNNNTNAEPPVERGKGKGDGAGRRPNPGVADITQVEPVIHHHQQGDECIEDTVARLWTDQQWELFGAIGNKHHGPLLLKSKKDFPDDVKFKIKIRFKGVKTEEKDGTMKYDKVAKKFTISKDGRGYEQIEMDHVIAMGTCYPGMSGNVSGHTLLIKMDATGQPENCSSSGVVYIAPAKEKSSDFMKMILWMNHVVHQCFKKPTEDVDNSQLPKNEQLFHRVPNSKFFQAKPAMNEFEEKLAEQQVTDTEMDKDNDNDNDSNKNNNANPINIEFRLRAAFGPPISKDA